MEIIQQNDNEKSDLLLTKPKDEACYNCKFCLSHKIDINQSIGMFGEIKKTGEEFRYKCYRYPEIRHLYNKLHWCGEWKSRF